MITSKKMLRFYLAADAIMNGQVFPHGRLKRLLFPSPIEKFLRTMRRAEYWHYRKTMSPLYQPIYLWYRMRYHRLVIKTGFDIPLNTFGYGLRIGHLSTIVINGNTKVGNYCSLSNNIVFADGHPKTIGNDVFFGSNVVLAKSLCIADGCKISACSFVNSNALIPNLLLGG